MLVLTRKLNDKILIGGNIVVTVVQFKNGQVRLGIEAPKDVPVFRAELLPPPSPATPVVQPTPRHPFTPQNKIPIRRSIIRQ